MGNYRIVDTGNNGHTFPLAVPSHWAAERLHGAISDLVALQIEAGIANSTGGECLPNRFEGIRAVISNQFRIVSVVEDDHESVTIPDDLPDGWDCEDAEIEEVVD